MAHYIVSNKLRGVFGSIVPSGQGWRFITMTSAHRSGAVHTSIEAAFPRWARQIGTMVEADAAGAAIAKVHGSK